MPALANQRHELFCRNLIDGAKNGWSATDAYLRAGYKGEEGVARACASRLLTNENIKRRLAELSAPAAKKTRLTAETLMSKFERIEVGAIEAGQFGPAGKAAELQGKLGGLMVDRLEVGGVNDFSHIQSLQDVAGALAGEVGVPAALEMLDELRGFLEALAAHQAIEVAPSYRRRDEVGPALKTLRNR